MTQLSGSLLTDDGSKTTGDLHLVAQPGPSRLATWWQVGAWPVVAWFCGIAAGVLWIYSGMPMICH
jgi:hypothetical protein